MDVNDLLGLRATFDRVALALERDGITTESVERLVAWGTVTFGRTLARVDGEAVHIPWASVSPYAHIELGGHMVQGAAPGDHIAPLLVKAVRACSSTALAYEKGYERPRLDAAIELGESWLDGSRRITAEDRDVRLPSVLRTLDAAARYGRLEDARVLAIELRAKNMQDWHIELEEH